MSKAKYPSKQQRRQKGARSLLSNPLILVLGGVILLAVAFFAVRKARQPAETLTPPLNAEAIGGPSLKVDKEKVDLGDVPLDQTVTVTFQLSNAGDKPLQFSEQPYIEVKQGC